MYDRSGEQRFSPIERETAYRCKFRNRGRPKSEYPADYGFVMRRLACRESPTIPVSAGKTLINQYIDDAMVNAIEYEAFEGTWPNLQKPVNKMIPVRALCSKHGLPQSNTEPGNKNESKDNDMRSNIDNLTREVKALQESVDIEAKLST
ncbi:hypothetical protein CHS0354_026320 [Potamilus streckersoni]|uniref:Uncharacterized protein n=1 Tax=Potamilus streckersoni TaxID=2493646 RepID=A0AAE0WB97_9BIVA|nr:hypothetical protein CHS0354_026320 [Potamilus streckersoni]